MKDSFKFRNTTYETCPHCDKDSEISVDAVGKCSHCGESILPCSACEQGFSNKCDWSIEYGCSRFPKE